MDKTKSNKMDPINPITPTTKNNNSLTSNIKVFVRLRPLLNHQLKQKQCIKSLQNEQSIQISEPPNITREKVDKVFNTKCTQKQLYDYIHPTIQKIAQGYNVTIFSYGQTNSGKTYTMFGSDWVNILAEKQTKAMKKKQQTFYGSIESDDNFAGVIPRSIYYIFNKIFLKKKNIQIFCSFLQLYNQKLIDLLQGEKNQNTLIIHQNKDDGIYVEGLTEIKVKDFEQCIEIMKKGQKNRIVRQTHMNIKSSRSHTIFQLLIQQVFPQTRTFKRTKLNLCDLAGSQKINKAEEMQLQHFKQLKNINLSLTTLGKVIYSLSSNDSSVPCYRESKLTRLLQDSLGGNTFTNIIANITTKYSNLEQSLSTLKFVQRAKQVKVQVFVKTYQQKPELQQMQKQIIYLKGLIKGKRDLGTSSLAERIKQLEIENKQLKKIADKELFNKMLEQNNKMKRQLMKLGNETIVNKTTIHNDPLITIQKEQFSKPKSDFNSEREDSYKFTTKKFEKSLTIDKNSTNTELPEVKFLRSSNKQSYQPPRGFQKNIIMRRLDLLQRIKRQNKQKLQKQLIQIQKMNESRTNLQKKQSNSSHSQYVNFEIRKNSKY